MSGPHYTKTRKMVTSKINPYRMLENTVCIKLVSCIGFLSVLPKSSSSGLIYFCCQNQWKVFFFCFSGYLTERGNKVFLFSMSLPVKFETIYLVIEQSECVQASVFMYYYYINTNEIPSELQRENLISSRVKITCYLHT